MVRQKKREQTKALKKVKPRKACDTEQLTQKYGALVVFTTELHSTVYEKLYFNQLVSKILNDHQKQGRL